MNLVVLGAPGAGKGTQSRNLAKHYNIVHISTGDLLRNEMKNKTEIGLQITDMMNKGHLVPDEIVTDILKERLSLGDLKNGFILDGYPRNILQAKILCDIVNIDRVISVEVADKIIVERMSGRYICPNCSSVYHLLYHPPKKSKTCDNCGTRLAQRDDDKSKTVKQRLKIYHEITEPIKEFYKTKNILISVDGTKDIEEITGDIVTALGVNN